MEIIHLIITIVKIDSSRLVSLIKGQNKLNKVVMGQGGFNFFKKMCFNVVACKVLAFKDCTYALLRAVTLKVLVLKRKVWNFKIITSFFHL
jgi:hypothetical protein